jgi:hypothetical protein
MKTQVEKNQNKKEITLLQLSKDLKKLNNEIKSMKQNTVETNAHINEVYFKLRRDIPFIFQNEDGHELFKTFNLSILPRVGDKMNLRPSEDSCCLNSYLMKEFDLTIEQLASHAVENETFFSFIISDVATNILIIQSHPEDEWDDCNCMNFEGDGDEYNMTYVITLVPNNVVKKRVLVEKIR